MGYDAIAIAKHMFRRSLRRSSLASEESEVESVTPLRFRNGYRCFGGTCCIISAWTALNPENEPRKPPPLPYPPPYARNSSTGKRQQVPAIFVYMNTAIPEARKG